MLSSSRARQVLLALTGLAFALIAIAALVAPEKIAEPFRYGLGHVDSKNEFRAVYVGLWGAHAAACALAIKHIHNALTGDVIGMLVIGQGVGRVVSLVVDGVPTAAMWPMFVVELVGGTMIRPTR
jgi:hypothetical protein